MAFCGVAVVGAGLMLALGVMSIEEAWRSIHYEISLLLFGMMIVVVNLRLSAFFRWVARHAIQRAHASVSPLIAIVGVTGVLRPCIVNDTRCIVMTPLVVEITRTLRRRPLPYLLAVATSSNIGGAATITGNPQNMMIGSFSGISFAEFFYALAPVALFGMSCTVLFIYFLHRDEFASTPRIEVPDGPVYLDCPLLAKSLFAAAALFLAFFAGVPVATGAMVAERGREAHVITFWECTRVGLPLTLLTLFAGVLWLA